MLLKLKGFKIYDALMYILYIRTCITIPVRKWIKANISCLYEVFTLVTVLCSGHPVCNAVLCLHNTLGEGDIMKPILQMRQWRPSMVNGRPEGLHPT